MRMVFCGGGTAGHVNPAIAIAETLKHKYPNAGILFIGRTGGGENRLVEACGLPLETIDIHGLVRQAPLKSIKTLLTLPRTISACKDILRRFSPDAVLGTGGYVSYPVLRAAQSMGLVTALHESNATHGLTVRLLAPRCTRVYLNFPEENADPRYRVVGMPVREAFRRSDRHRARQRLGLSDLDFLLLSFGGSIGAQRINEACIALMRDARLNDSHFYHFHGCGERFYEETKTTHPDLCRERGNRRILPYINDMADRLAAADLVICRSGAGTIGELAAVGASAILIPSPNVADDHQRKNAERLSTVGGCIMIEEADLDAEKLARLVCELRAAPSRRSLLSERIRRFSHPDCAERILCDLDSCRRESKSNAH